MIHAVFVLRHLDLHPIVFVLESFATAVCAGNVALAAMLAALLLAALVLFGLGRALGRRLALRGGGRRGRRGSTFGRHCD